MVYLFTYSGLSLLEMSCNFYDIDLGRFLIILYIRFLILSYAIVSGVLSFIICFFFVLHTGY